MCQTFDVRITKEIRFTINKKLLKYPGSSFRNRKRKLEYSGSLQNKNREDLEI